MLKVRKGQDRGYADHGWLKSFHSFSFADYHDPAHMGVGNLRVINEDRIAPGTGFGTHSHRDMEIVSYVLDGALGHKDDLWASRTPSASASQGGASALGRPGGGPATADGVQIIVPGEVQRMSAGTGIAHSEHNAAADQPTHFLQIWLLPNQRGIAPGYEQKAFSDADKRGRLRLVASPDGRDGSVTIHADASMYAGLLDADDRTALVLDPKRLAYVHLVRGQARVNGQALAAGDAVTLDGESRLEIDQARGAEVIVFDLAR